MARLAYIFLIYIAALSIPHKAFAWCDNCGANGCCRCPTGQAQCLGSYSSCEEACGLTTPVVGGGSSLPGVQGAFIQGVMNGLINGVRNSQQQRPLSPYQIQQLQLEQQQEQQAEIARLKAEQERQQKIQAYLQAKEQAKKLKEAKLDREAQDGMDLLGSSPAPTLSDQELIGQSPNNDVRDKSEGYQKGYNHAMNCISRSAGSSCSAGTAQQTILCVQQYNGGYDAGLAKVQLAMKEAYESGEQAGRKGQLSNGAADPRASGGCRTEWIESYNRGYFAGKHSNE